MNSFVPHFHRPQARGSFAVERWVLLLCFALGTWSVPAIEPEIRDGKVIFRIAASNAKEVTLTGEWAPSQREAMTRGDKGVWTLAKELKPQIYYYTIRVDGLAVLDPRNPRVKPGSSLVNYVEVPAQPPAFYEFQEVPHGAVATHTYSSKVTATQRRMVVYMPPGYDMASAAGLPVLYLLHGSGDDETGWTAFGRAHFIADNLIAQKKMKPMLIVMPNGHAYKPGESVAPGVRPTSVFQEDLFDNIIPLIEKIYRVKPGRDHLAIMGLSMGGRQSFTIGLENLDRFSHVGVYSYGGSTSAEPLAKLLADPKGANAKLKFFWIGCGRDDKGFSSAKEISESLTKGGIKHVFHPSDGAHTWQVWRDYLRDTLPLLFR